MCGSVDGMGYLKSMCVEEENVRRKLCTFLGEEDGWYLYVCCCVLWEVGEVENAGLGYLIIRQ